MRDYIVTASDKLLVSDLHIGLEVTSVYRWHSAMFLHEDAALTQELLLEKYSLDEIGAMDVAEFVTQYIQKTARASYRLSKCTEDSIDFVLGTSIQSIRAIQAQVMETGQGH